MCHLTCLTFQASQTTSPTAQTSDPASPHQDPHTLSLICPLSLRRAMHMVQTHTIWVNTVFKKLMLTFHLLVFQPLSSNPWFHLLHHLPPLLPSLPSLLPFLQDHLLLLPLRLPHLPLTAPRGSLRRQTQVCGSRELCSVCMLKTWWNVMEV